ncbi:hypothetical protein PFISCL1PPCAC_17745, partial [Pristionchus fissidentatus]
PLYLDQNGTLGDLALKGIEECAKDGAFLPIIRSDQENSMFDEIAFDLTKGITNSPRIILGMVCNSSTRRLEWMDGSKIIYTYKNLDVSFDCVSEVGLVYSKPTDDSWFAYPAVIPFPFTVLCVIDPSEDSCGKYEQMSISKDESKSCFKIYDGALSWTDAQETCENDFGDLATINSEEENKFFWRSAVGNNVLDDLHIGAHQSFDNGIDWFWIDGNKNITSDVYSNFIDGFPVAGGGKCAAMLTESPAARWINEDCNIQKLPFICRRSGLRKPLECPTAQPNQGEDIYAPGFPLPSAPCEYTFLVDINYVVKLEIVALEANPGIVFLEVYDGPVGRNLLANLTGSTPTPNKFTTKSNVMRVNWNPNMNDRPANYRG